MNEHGYDFGSGIHSEKILYHHESSALREKLGTKFMKVILFAPRRRERTI